MKKLATTFKERLRAAGYPILLLSPSYRRILPINAGPCASGNLSENGACLYPFCRAWDHPNLFVVDDVFSAYSAAVNPSLTIAAQALRVADHIVKTDDWFRRLAWDTITLSLAAALPAACSRTVCAVTHPSKCCSRSGWKRLEPTFPNAGGLRKNDQGLASWGWSTMPQKHLNGRVLVDTQARVIGGGSSINAQLYTRGNAKDDDARAATRARPGGATKQVCYFKRSEDNQKLRQRLPRLRRPARRLLSNQSATDQLRVPSGCAGTRHPLQLRLQRAVQDGIGHHQLSTRNAERSSASATFVKPVQSRTEPHGPVLDADAEDRHPEQGRAVGIAVASGTGTETLHADREVIMRGDWFAWVSSSPALGQPTSSRAAAGVNVMHDLPGVSCSNMQDHLHPHAIRKCTGDHTYDRVAVLMHRTLWAGLQYFLFRPRAGHLHPL